VVNHARVYWDGLLTHIFGSFEALMQKVNAEGKVQYYRDLDGW